VHNFTISLDGYGAGPRQTGDEPLGVDDDIAGRFGEGVDAWVMGRDMFGPIRGPWRDDDWREWWGKNPSYHRPVFVLTHHARPPIEMDRGTVFRFVTTGARGALRRATEVAGGKGCTGWRRVDAPSVP
jgi:dihydrofolate reductase